MSFGVRLLVRCLDFRTFDFEPFQKNFECKNICIFIIDKIHPINRARKFSTHALGYAHANFPTPSYITPDI